MKYILLVFSLIWANPSAHAKIQSYTFDINHITVNKTGEDVQAMAIGGSIPAPLIEARLGDTLEVTFHNKMTVETSVHWHGILLPPDQDGVPFLNTKPISAGESFTFRFDIKHTGTYWYHSHTGLQEERGIYGPIRLLPKDHMVSPDQQDLMLVWSDWTNEDPDKILRNLKRDGDYYALKKDSVQSWDKVIAHGPQAIKARLKSALERMEQMDLSDIGYDAFLANGDITHQLTNAKAGETVKIRMINAAASSYFNVEFSGGPMTIVAVDGIDIEPLKVKRLKHAIAETYDILITLPEEGNWELRATNTDGTGYTSAYVGSGSKMTAPDIMAPNPFLADHSMHMKSDNPADEEDKNDPKCMPMHAAMGHCTPKSGEGKVIDHLTTYDPIRAPEPTIYPDHMPLRKVELNLTGNMERYIWSFNGKTMSEADRIMIKKGERVQFIFNNKTMMNHPLHLHGHFFRVLNGQGDYSPLKHTVDLASMSSITIEFAANEEADWIFHCHNLYHMKSGMSRVISYKDSSTISDQFAQSLSADSHWYKFADLDILSNQHSGRAWMVNNRYSLELEWEGDYDGTYEADARGEYFINRYTEAFAGVEREKGHHKETTAYAGVSLVLPMLIDASLRVDDTGHIRFDVGSSLQITNRTKFHWLWNSDSEYELMMDYEISKKLSLIAKQHHDYDFGVGLKFKF